jgi:hypothetical protein
MTQVEREQEQPEHVKTRHKIILEAVNHHRIDIVMTERIRLEQRKARIGFAESEMRKVISDKCEHDQAAHHHVTGGKRRFDVAFIYVRLGPGTAILDRKQDREVNVKTNSDEKKSSNQPKERTQIVQVLRVTVDPIGSNENLQIPQQMSDDKKNQNGAGDGDDDFFSNRGAIKSR